MASTEKQVAGRGAEGEDGVWASDTSSDQIGVIYDVVEGRKARRK